MPPAGLSSLGRVRPAAALFVLALFAAACSSDKQAAPTTTEAPPAALKPSPAPAPPPKRSKVHVIVFDGDTGAPVAKARVQVGRFANAFDDISFKAFGDTVASEHGISTAFAKNANTIAYYSPSFNNFSFAASSALKRSRLFAARVDRRSRFLIVSSVCSSTVYLW